MRVDPHACIMQALDPRINFRTQFQAPQRKFEGRRGCALSGLALFNAQQQRASPSAPQAAARGPRLAPTPPSACSQGDAAGGKPALAARHPERGLGEGGPSAAATALHLLPGGAGWRPGEPATR